MLGYGGAALNLTTKGRYGLRAAFTLACRYGEAPISLRDIASQQQLAEKYLEQLLTALRKAGLVQTVRGAQGGYLLSAPPDQISVGQVLVALEGDMLLVDCLRDNICGNTEHCAARKVWKRLSDSILSALNSITLQDMINDSLTPTGPCPNDSR